jgi:hypothetical protein
MKVRPLALSQNYQVYKNYIIILQYDVLLFWYHKHQWAIANDDVLPIVYAGSHLGFKSARPKEEG